jgi:hypothetical protein
MLINGPRRHLATEHLDVSRDLQRLGLAADFPAQRPKPRGLSLVAAGRPVTEHANQVLGKRAKEVLVVDPNFGLAVSRSIFEWARQRTGWASPRAFRQYCAAHRERGQRKGQIPAQGLAQSSE